MNRMNGSTLAHKHHTPAPAHLRQHLQQKHEYAHPNWEIEYREKQFETRYVRLRVDVYSLQYASTATVLSRNRLIFKLFQISELKHHANKKIHSNRQCKIYEVERVRAVHLSSSLSWNDNKDEQKEKKNRVLVYAICSAGHFIPKIFRSMCAFCSHTQGSFLLKKGRAIGIFPSALMPHFSFYDIYVKREKNSPQRNPM